MHFFLCLQVKIVSGVAFVNFLPILQKLPGDFGGATLLRKYDLEITEFWLVNCENDEKLWKKEKKRKTMWIYKMKNWKQWGKNYWNNVKFWK